MSTALTVAKRSDIVALNPSDPRVEGLLYNIKMGGGLSIADIPKVKNPSGGALVFGLDIPGREPEYIKEMTGLILHAASRRTLWADKSIGSGESPVCESRDMENARVRKDEMGGLDVPENILKIAMPGGEEGKCVGCAFNEWGTAVDGNGRPTRGKACAESRVIYFLRVGDVLPVQITVPSGSLQAFSLAIKALPIRADKAVVKLSLTKAKSGGGVDFAQYNLSFVSALDDESYAAVGEYGKMLEKVFANASATRDTVKALPRNEPQGKTCDTF